MKRLLTALASTLLLVSVLLAEPAFSHLEATTARAQGGSQDDVDELLKAYAAALDREMSLGNTRTEEDPALGAVTILDADAQLRMDRLWAQTLAEIELIQGRPESERALAVDAIRKVTGLQPAYLSQAGTPYDPSLELEEYSAGKYIYQVEVDTNRIVMVWPIDQREVDLAGVSSDDELKEIAVGYVERLAPGVNTTELVLSVGSKGGAVFFRWEDANSRLFDGTTAFLQVGVSRAGILLDFENRLPADTTASTGLRGLLAGLWPLAPAYAIGANEIYANGGSRWAWEIHNQSHSTQSNAGYCYLYGCSPTNFYYATSPSGNNTYGGTNHRGRWSATSYMRYRNTRVSAFIPSTHATTTAVFYRKWYNGGSSSTDGAAINQSIWYNTWVQASNTLYDIAKVVVPNTSESGSWETAWDEIWDYVP